jgi:hypothetical protein
MEQHFNGNVGLQQPGVKSFEEVNSRFVAPKR